MRYIGHSRHAAGAEKRHFILLLVGCLVVILILTLLPRAAAAGEAWKAILADGKQEFEESCVSCHGADGKGGGEFAAKLVAPPKDLTAIAATNGGEFPFTRVFDIIAGELDVPGHSPHQMPEFYARLKAKDYTPGYLPAHVRVLELAHYLESIQDKPVD